MSRFAVVSLVFLAAAAAAGIALEPGARAIAWATGGAAYIGVIALGVCSMRLRLFCEAVCRVEVERPWVALTFDDGPDPRATPALLDLLRELSVPAAFFCIGARAEAHPALLERMRQDGHLVGNHSYAHAWWTNLLPARPMRRELARAQASLGRILGERPTLFRPPMGLTNPGLRRAVQAEGLRVIGWDVGGRDQGARAPRRVAERVVNGARPGSIIMLHDGRVAPEALTETVRRVVEGLRARGLAFVRLDELLRAAA